MVTGLFHHRLRADIDHEAYTALQFAMFERVTSHPEFGFIDLKLYEAPDGDRVLVGSFESHEAIRRWVEDSEHRKAQERGREEFYERYWTGEITVRATFDREHGRTQLAE